MNRMKLRAAAALLTVLLLGCLAARPLGGGQLLNERSQVFLRKSGQSAQEMAQGASQTTTVGDEIWTQSRGRALLKFTDLWLRLYDDTTLRAEDVTPASIKLTLGQGATLAGKTPGAEHIEIVAGDPPIARIVVAGTLLMIARPSAESDAIVRLFSGAVEVLSLRTGERARLETPGWIVITPDGRISRPDDEQMRPIARERGWWDIFREIERDAAGFGPPAGRVAAERVTPVFEERLPAACTEPPVLEIAEPKVADLVVRLDGRALPGCPDDPIVKFVIEWGDGSATAGSFPTRHRYAQAGTYTIIGRALSQQGRESQVRRSVTVRSPTPEPALPNLIGRIVKAPGKAVCGQELGDSVVVQVVNRSNTAAGEFYISLYLAEEEKLTPQAIRLSPAVRPDPRTVTTPGGSTFVERLAAGQAVELIMRGANPIPKSLPEGTRTYWLLILVDETAAVNESNEDDNVGPGWPITIGCLR